ncbi:MAG: hypothetical protein A2161_22345 [Candidatus Schekmanbacteria bacterium RBG_13_48_7]|uniref:Uncharacterized protein n=1 Tax=Candidatus Schekmanbacteria bacterium RBG_13_48_7 TaxID=1817878 RepID=A0A1F7RYQ2_9BACT|nr:MAG: hypothetical protein A2161_22345 [Candidatus Schekmanbacteria bacterium RBG_13_48_7]
MVRFFFRYGLIFAILYLILYFARDQKSTFFLVPFTDYIKLLSGFCFLLTVISFLIIVLRGGVDEISIKKCVRCNKPALKGFVYCHEHLKKSNEDYRKNRR